jgi:hypothetical protein
MTKTRQFQREDEAAIRQLVQDMQDGQHTKNGELFVSAFAQEHDYIAKNGIFLPNQTPQEGREGAREGYGRPLRRGAHPDAGYG